MLLKEFRDSFLEQILTFLWRQWSALGIMGESGAEDEWAIDPEALLVYSLDFARAEPRLFDEILFWLLTNGKWLDTARIKRMLEIRSREHGKHGEFKQVLGGIFQFLSSHGEERKWGNIAKFCRSEYEASPVANTKDPPEALFMGKSENRHPLVQGDNIDPDFILFGLNRPKIKIHKQARDVPINSHTNIRFLLRTIFGTGAKSECILYLLTHEGARPKEIADDVGLFWLGIHQTLLDLSRSGLILTRTKGKKVEYWVSHKKWWDFLSYSGQENTPKPKWLNWTAIYLALVDVWQTLSVLAAFENLDYLRSSKLQDSLEVLAQEFSRGGLDIPRIPSMGIPTDLYQKTALQFLGELFGISVPSPLRGEGQGEGVGGRV